MNRYCDDMVIGMDDEEFKGRMEIANENVDTLIGYETSVMNIILYLSMCAALDCYDAERSDEALDSDIDILYNVTDLVKSKIEGWGWKQLELDSRPEPEGDDRIELFMDAQGFLEDMLNDHLELFDDTDDGHNEAYLEVSNMIVYMISAVCSRCSDIDKAITYAVDSMRRTFAFIRDECTLIPKEEPEPQSD